MTPLAVVQLILELEPELQSLVADLIRAVKANDPVAERKAWEAAIVLQFEARKA